MCGAKVDENDDVCPRCGVKVTSPKTMKKKSSSKRNRIIWCSGIFYVFSRGSSTSRGIFQK